MIAKTASMAWKAATVISFMYMLLLLPHIAGITAEHFTYIWFWAGLAVALLWMPLIWTYGRLSPQDSHLQAALSFAPLGILLIFFCLLLYEAG